MADFFDELLEWGRIDKTILNPHFAEENLKSELNETQYQSVIDINNNCLVIAWAWSWKTKVLTSKIANLIFWYWVHPKEIFAVTFTNKAAKEIKERIDLWNIKLQSNFNIQDFEWVGTFHSLFLKILKEEILHIGDFFTINWKSYKKRFTIYDTNDTKTLVKKIIKQNNLDTILEHKDVINFISKVKNLWFLPDSIWLDFDNKEGNFNETIWNRDIFKKYLLVYKEYQKSLLYSNAVDFDDLLLFPYLLFKKYPNILEKYQRIFSYLLVDEAQDTNWIQFELLRLLTAKKNNYITFVGDDYQSIYWWRWAMMNNFLNIPNLWDNVKIYKLEINYRSREHIVKAWQAVIDKNAIQFEKQMSSYKKTENPENEKIKILNCSNSYKEAEQIVSFIKAMQEKKQNNRSDYAILYRKNALSQPFEQCLLEKWIPYTIFGGYKFFDREEVKDIISFLKIYLNPNDNISLIRIIALSNLKIGASTINKLTDYSTLNNIDLLTLITNIEQYALDLRLNKGWITKIKGLNDFICDIQAVGNSMTLIWFINYIISLIKYKEYLLKKYDRETADDKMENIGQVINLASSFEKTKIGAEAVDEFLNHISLITDIKENNWNKNIVSLMSIHASKWLEFENVFIVGAEQEIFPSLQSTLNKKTLEEERRLMYVAITRAKDNLFISYANTRLQWGMSAYCSESMFLKEIPIELKKEYLIK